MVGHEDEPDLLVDFPCRHILLQIKVLKLGLNLDRLEYALARLDVLALDQIFVTNRRCHLAHDILRLQMLANQRRQKEVDTEITEHVL